MFRIIQENYTGNIRELYGDYTRIIREFTREFIRELYGKVQANKFLHSL